MLAMQYSFVLPADYDMAVIDERIETKGHLLNGFPHLKFKAYLSAKKQDEACFSPENLYAPFYLWEEAEGATQFLSHQGFEALTGSFGRPNLDIWLPLAHKQVSDLSASQFATRRIIPIAPQTNIDTLRMEMNVAVNHACETGAAAAFAGFDPNAWRSVFFAMWKVIPSNLGDGTQSYRVGYIAN